MLDPVSGIFQCSQATGQFVLALSHVLSNPKCPPMASLCVLLQYHGYRVSLVLPECVFCLFVSVVKNSFNPLKWRLHSPFQQELNGRIRLLKFLESLYSQVVFVLVVSFYPAETRQHLHSDMPFLWKIL